MSTPTFGDICFEAAAAEKLRLKRSLTVEEWKEVINQCAHRENIRRMRKKTTAPAKPAQRPRNVVFDTLAELEGVNGEVTDMQAGKIGKCAAQIRKAMKGFDDADIADEIRARAARYRSRHPQWTYSCTALCSHWAKLKPAEAKPTLDLYKEPTGDWRAIATKAYPGASFSEITWPDVSPDIRRKILEELQRATQT